MAAVEAAKASDRAAVAERAAAERARVEEAAAAQHLAAAQAQAQAQAAAAQQQQPQRPAPIITPTQLPPPQQGVQQQPQLPLSPNTQQAISKSTNKNKPSDYKWYSAHATRHSNP